MDWMAVRSVDIIRHVAEEQLWVTGPLSGLVPRVSLSPLQKQEAAEPPETEFHGCPVPREVLQTHSFHQASGSTGLSSSPETPLVNNDFTIDPQGPQTLCILLGLAGSASPAQVFHLLPSQEDAAWGLKGQRGEERASELWPQGALAKQGWRESNESEGRNGKRRL